MHGDRRRHAISAMLKSRAGCFEIPCSSEDPRAFHVVKILARGRHDTLPQMQASSGRLAVVSGRRMLPGWLGTLFTRALDHS
jgi:hypothetical protein